MAALVVRGACAVGYAMPAGNFLFPTALADGADPSSCFALSEITATTSWCVKSCGAKPSICPPDLCSCSSPARASASPQKVALFVDPEKKALDLAANTLQAEQQQVTTNTLQVSEQQVNASDTGTHMPAKALFKALEFGNPSAIGMVNINDTFVNGSSALVQAEADGGNQSAKAFWRALEFGPPNGESIGNTTYMNGTVVAAKLDATVLQEAEQQTQGRTAGPANVSDKAFWRDIEFGKASESSIGNTTYMNGTVVVPATIMPKADAIADAAVLSATPFTPAVVAPVAPPAEAAPAEAAPAVAAAAAPAVIQAAAAAPEAASPAVAAEPEEPPSKTAILLKALDTAAAAVPATSSLGGTRVRAPKGGMSFINFLSFKKSKDALPEDPNQGIEKTSAPAEAARNPWASRHETPAEIINNNPQLGLAETVALINAQGEAAMKAREAAAPDHEKGFVGILRGATDIEKQSAEQRAEIARKNFEQAVAAAEETKALEESEVPGTFRKTPPVEVPPATVPGAIAFSSLSGGSGLFSAFEDHRSGSEDPLPLL